MNYFFNNEETGESIDEPIAASLETVLETFENLPPDRSSFLGIENRSGKILQFAFEENNKWLIDIPNMDTMTARQGYGSTSACIEIIKGIFAGRSYDEISKLATNSIL